MSKKKKKKLTVHNEVQFQRFLYRLKNKKKNKKNKTKKTKKKKKKKKTKKTKKNLYSKSLKLEVGISYSNEAICLLTRQ